MGQIRNPMLYPFELRALNELRGTDLRLWVKLHAIGFALLLLRSDLRSLGKGLLVFYQAIYGQIAVPVIHNIVATIDRISLSSHDRHSGFLTDSGTIQSPCCESAEVMKVKVRLPRCFHRSSPSRPEIDNTPLCVLVNRTLSALPDLHTSEKAILSFLAKDACLEKSLKIGKPELDPHD